MLPQSWAYSMAKKLSCGNQIRPQGVNHLMDCVECEDTHRSVFRIKATRPLFCATVRQPKSCSIRKSVLGMDRSRNRHSRHDGGKRRPVAFLACEPWASAVSPAKTP